MKLPPYVTYRQFDHWVTKGWVKVIGGGMGPGSQREITNAEYRILTIMGELVRNGIRTEHASDIARALEADGVAKIGKYTLRRDA